MVWIQDNNRSRYERRALAVRDLQPAQLGLAGAAQLGCLHRQLGQNAKEKTEYLVTRRAADQLDAEAFVKIDRKYWGVESGLHQPLDCSGFEDRVRIRHKGGAPHRGTLCPRRRGVVRALGPRASGGARTHVPLVAGMECRAPLAHHASDDRAGRLTRVVTGPKGLVRQRPRSAWGDAASWAGRLERRWKGRPRAEPTPLSDSIFETRQPFGSNRSQPTDPAPPRRDFLESAIFKIRSGDMKIDKDFRKREG